MPFAATWMDVKTVILSDESQKNEYRMIPFIHVTFKKSIEMNLFTKQK